MNSNPYDQLPYRCQPIEWTAPERLALASFLHGGPLPDLRGCRVLELGCGDGSNLLPLAFYRPQASFVGVDGAGTQLDIAESRRRQLQLRNVEFVHQDFLRANAALDGEFDFIIAHGVFSWVPDHVRDALFDLCRQRLSENGLLYLNYNTRPGWNVRGMVRDYLLKLTDAALPLLQRAHHAQAAAAKMAHALAGESHPFSQLLANEFQFVCDNHHSYVAHEYLAEFNQPYWRSEFIALAARYGFHPVVDADYNYPSGRAENAMSDSLQLQGLAGLHLSDTEDLLNYRQLHTPILCRQAVKSVQPDARALCELQIASCLQSVGRHPSHWFGHPNGYQVEVKDAALAQALMQLTSHWPYSISVTEFMQDVESHVADLLLLHHNGLLELRLPDAPVSQALQPLNLLNQLELSWGGYCTTAHHQRVEDVHPAPAERFA